MKSSSLFGLAISAGLLPNAVNAQASYKVGQQVQTTSGSIVGRASDWKPEVSEYLGVPFAEPPVGPLRWLPPRALNSPAKVVNATAYVSALTPQLWCCSKGLPGIAITDMTFC
jgi:hypothetical protein